MEQQPYLLFWLQSPISPRLLHEPWLWASPVVPLSHFPRTLKAAPQPSTVSLLVSRSREVTSNPQPLPLYPIYFLKRPFPTVLMIVSVGNPLRGCHVPQVNKCSPPVLSDPTSNSSSLLLPHLMTVKLHQHVSVIVWVGMNLSLHICLCVSTCLALLCPSLPSPCGRSCLNC
jgi:hypothetical protein